jgi:hypothetical protein
VRETIEIMQGIWTNLTVPLLSTPFQDVPVSTTLDDLKRMKEESMPEVDAS